MVESLLSSKLYEACLASLDPKQLIGNQLSVDSIDGRPVLLCLKGIDKSFDLQHGCRLVGFGKAVLGMAAAAVELLGSAITGGVISLPHGISSIESMQKDLHTCRQVHIEIHEGAKDNLPDADSLKAAGAIVSCVSGLEATDLVVVLISGGGSALLPWPLPGITLADKAATIRELSRRGANITQLNIVRQRLSGLKGGGLAKLLHPAQAIALILSDVIGDPLEIIASGPTVQPTAGPTAAADIVRQFGLTPADLGPAVSQVLFSDTDNIAPENERIFCRVTNLIVGNISHALLAIVQEARKRGHKALLVSNCTAGEARLAGEAWAQLAALISRCLNNPGQSRDNLDRLAASLAMLNSSLEVATVVQLASSWCKNCLVDSCLVLVGGGETTVTVRGSGRGGRNQEMVLAFGLAMESLPTPGFSVEFLSCGTDGIDGPTDAAGAVYTSEIWNGLGKSRLIAADCLAANDSHTLWKVLGGLLRPGHTGTNVMDVQILVIRPTPPPTLKYLD